MKAVLDQEISVIVFDHEDENGQPLFRKELRSARSVILNPEGLHLDSVLEAVRFALAGIILLDEQTTAQEEANDGSK